MATVFDVANFILENRQKTTAWQLQKLCYYSKAWSLALMNNAMFDEPFEAWKDGPVCRVLYYKHQGHRYITRGLLPKSKKQALTEEGEALIKSVLNKYGSMSGDELRDLSHSELPWRITRGDLPEGVNCDKEISNTTIREYYSNQSDDLKKIDDFMLAFIAKKRLTDAHETVPFAEMMGRFGITEEDLEGEEIEYEIEPIIC